jgi:drug/metabolite transporter (DMT)-like permease
MNPNIVFIILAGVSAGCYNFFQKIASRYLAAPFVAITASIVVMLVSATVLISAKFNHNALLFEKKGIIAALAVGVAASGIELFAVWAYARGLQVTIGAPVMAALPMLTTITLGILFLGENMNLTKGIAMLMVLSGVVLLSKA